MKFYLNNFISLFRSTGEFVRTPSTTKTQDKPIIKNALSNHDSVQPLSTQDTPNTQTLLPIHKSSKPLPTRDKDITTIPSRQQWSSPVEFLLSCISMSVGLGNVWRFPFTAYENGGGAFLIPYLLVLLLVGRPLYFLELSLGQFSSSGSVKVWDLAPAFRGVGLGQVLATCCVVSYYCSLIALSIYYLVVSCQAVLPWTVCHADLADNLTLCVPSGTNKSQLGDDKNLTRISSSEQYFRAGVLKEKPDISSGIGFPDPALSACLAVCWVLLYLTLRKGVSSSGKVAYFTAIFPYIVMLTLLVRGLTLPGASQGLLYFFTPQWHRLLDPNVWYAAVTQAFFSLSIGFGSLITFSSYNRFCHPTHRDALIICFADSATSILAGTVIFSILGYLAYELDLPIEKVVNSGAGLAFVSYPEVLAKFDFLPQVFAVLFFLMLITLGMGSAVGLTNNVISVICDYFPSTSRSLITALISLAGLSTGLLYVTPGGQPILELVDYYGGSLLILILALIEIIAIAWIYRVNNVVRDINFMLKMNLGMYWKICWGVFIPICLGTILSYAMYMYKPPSYGGIPLSLPAQIAGWILVTLGVLFVPFMFLLSIFNSRGTFLERLVVSFRPSPTWGPLDIQDRCDWVRKKEEQAFVSPWTPHRTVIQLTDEFTNIDTSEEALTNINIDTSEDAQAEMDESASFKIMYVGGQYIYQ